MFRILMLLSLLAAWSVHAQTAPYVNAAVADSEFHKITAAHMDRLRELKILFGSRSFGYNLWNGLNSLASKDAVYDFNDKYVNYDVFNNGGRVDIVDADAFDRYNFVHFMCTASPWQKRNYEFDELMREWPHNFTDDINVGMLYYHGGDAATFPVYSAIFDSLRNQYPHITFIYVTGGYEAVEQVAHNTNAAAFNALVRAKYQGVVPLYDLGRILNDDDRCGDNYCPEYSTDPAGVHPNTTFAQERMGKGLLVMLYKLFCEQTPVCTGEALGVPAGLAGYGASLHATRLTWTPANSACNIDRFLVRRNGVNVGEAFGPGFNDFNLTENTVYTYSVATLGHAGDTSAYCTPVAVRTLNDSIAPGIADVPTTIVSTQVVVQFTEDVDTASATLAANYTIDGGVNVLGAEMTGTDEVTLTTTTLAENVTYTITVSGVTDRSDNANAMSGVQATFKYSLMTVNDDYAGYWAFENSVADSSANAKNAVWSGTPAYADLGVKGTCISMDGSDSCGFILINDNGIMDGQPAFTVCLWAKKDAAAAGGYLLQKHVSYQLVTGANNLSGYFFNAKAVRLSFSASNIGIDDTDWHHFALTHDGDTSRVYVDGRQVYRGAMEDSLEDNTRQVYVGRNPFSPMQSFPGDIDEVRVYHWALDASELTELITGAAVNRDSLAVRALLDANGDTRSVDGAATFNAEGRITQLLLQADVGGSISSITSHIGQLTELEVLHAYGPQSHDHSSPYLVSVDPAIGNCTKLQTLLLNDNDLADLPLAITRLESLTVFSVGNNLLCGINDSLKGWLDAVDPDWEGTQVCSADTGDTSGIAIRPATGPASAHFDVSLMGSMLQVSRTSSAGFMQVDVLAVDGTAVYSIQNSGARQVHWEASVPAGVYFVNVRDDAARMTVRVVVIP